ncbi:MAG: ATP-binding protein [Bacteroidales bacterium]|nr:ATP-binding protein [Bacteroidales bacterium]
MNIVGRKEEMKELQRIYDSGSSEFVVVYGRRRVGKTYLIREFFHDDFVFYATGVARGNRTEQLAQFNSSLARYGDSEDQTAPENWFLAFGRLEKLVAKSRKQRKVIFLDELPWMDTPKSDFVKALEMFWNVWASARNDIVLIVCGSAASWMVCNVIRNRGGLHNRLTCKLKLNPFTLSETKEYLLSQKIKWDNLSIAECYMILGGIPYYLHLLDKSRSLAQNIDRLFFSESALLEDEFDNLYNSLFAKSEEYVRIVEALAKKKSGFTRDEIVARSGLSNGGGLTRKLDALEQCGFIRKYKAFGEVSYTFQLIDFFTLFYFQFVKGRNTVDYDTWQHLVATNSYKTWRGLAFEKLCFAHLPKIKSVLGISGVLTNTCSYYSSQAQVDMIIERADRAVTVCEMKCSDEPYALTKAEYEKIANRLSVLREYYKRKNIFFAMITSFGLVRNSYAINYVQNEIILDDLF